MPTATEPQPSITATRRAARTIGAIVLGWGILCALHEGEFWPFSIYPMFSQAGRPWTRVLVRDVTGTPPARDWSPYSLETLPGVPVPLSSVGVFQNDLADFVARTTVWGAPEVEALRAMFSDAQLRSRSLLVLKVHGSLDSRDSVRIVAHPWVLLGDRVTVNPAAGDGAGP